MELFEEGGQGEVIQPDLSFSSPLGSSGKLQNAKDQYGSENTHMCFLGFRYEHGFHKENSNGMEMYVL